MTAGAPPPHGHHPPWRWRLPCMSSTPALRGSTCTRCRLPSRCACARLPTLAALAPTSSPLLQQRLMGKATATAPTGSRIARSSQAIRLRNKPANSHGGSTRKCEKQQRVGRLVQGLLIEAVLEDGLDRAHRVRPQGEGALCGGFEPGVGVGLGQAQDAEAGAVALLGVAPGVEDLGDEGGGGGTDGLGPSREALGRLLLGEAPVFLLHRRRALAKF